MKWEGLEKESEEATRRNWEAVIREVLPEALTKIDNYLQELEKRLDRIEKRLELIEEQTI